MSNLFVYLITHRLIRFVMTAEQRLDQLELLMVQALATLDQHTAQNERHTTQLKMIISVITQQSDNTTFLLREQSEMKREQSEMKHEQSEMKREQSEMKREQAEMKHEQAEMKREQAEMKREQAEMKREQAEMKTEVTAKLVNVEDKLDRVLGLLSGQQG